MVGADVSTINARSGVSENGNPANGFEQSPKRMRACISCRNMKIKCVSVPGSKDCETCLRFSRTCQDPGPPKARVKTSQKFSELEKKIDALTSALDAERRRNQQSIKEFGEEPLWSQTPESSLRDDDASPRIVDNGGINGVTSRDVINQGLIDIHTASLLLNHWNLRMRPFMPILQLSVDEDIHTIRAKKPTLFLTIITIASTSIRPSLVPSLLTQLNNTLAQDVFIQGAKSLDLLQSLVLFSQYYIQPPHIKAFALPQHIYSAVVMSHDLGMASGARPGEKGNHDQEKEAYRTLLAVYLGASCSATLLRRHQPLMCTPSHRVCTEVLGQIDDGYSDDQWLCSLVVLQEIFDDVSKTLSISRTYADESYDDFRTQHLLGAFRQRLTDWKLSPSGNIDLRLKNYAASVADLYIHQIAVRIYLRQMHAWVDKKKQGLSQPPPEFTATHTDALCHCLKVSASAMNIYLSLDDATARSLPNVFLIWNLCVAVCLVKLGHFAEELPRSLAGGLDNNPPSPLSFLEAMIERLTALSQHGYFPQSRPFLNAFEKLKTWYQQKKIVCLNSNGGCDDGSGGPVHDILGSQTPPPSPPPPRSHISTSFQHQHQQQPQPQQPSPNSQGCSGDQVELQADINGAILIPEIQPTEQQTLGWDLNSHTFSQVKTPVDNGTISNGASSMNYGPGYFDGGLGAVGFNPDDMRDIDNFMSQTDDVGLWSLFT